MTQIPRMIESLLVWRLFWYRGMCNTTAAKKGDGVCQPSNSPSVSKELNDCSFLILLSNTPTMSASSKTYTHSYAPFSNIRSSVVRMKDGKFLEVRRGDITWTAAFRAAKPDVKQHIYDSLHDWHKHRLGYTCPHPHVTAWKMSLDPATVVPAIPEEGEKSYWLDFQLAVFMGGASATEEDLSSAIEDFSMDYPDSPFLTFLLGKNHYDVLASGDILTALEENGHILKKPAEWPCIHAWRETCLADLKLTDSDELNFSQEMTYFTKHLTGSWADVLKAFRSYGVFFKDGFQIALKSAKIKESAEDTGYIYTGTDICIFFGLNDGGKGFLSFSDFRKQMLTRGHLRPTAAAEKPSLLVVDLDVVTGERSCTAYEENDSESDDSDDSDYVPSESDSDSDSEFSGSDMEIDEEAAPAKKDPDTLKKEALKLVSDTLAYADRKFAELKGKKENPPVNPFAEIDATFFRVDAILTDESGKVSSFFNQILAHQFVAYCLRAEFETLWRTHTFERLQMRSSLMTWRDSTVVGEDVLAVSAIKEFLRTYPA